MGHSLKLLITGASGLLGSHLLQRAQWECWNFTGTRHRQADIPASPCISADLTDAAETEALFLKVKPNVVIHTAACTDLGRCEQFPELAHKIHVQATRHIVHLANKYSARVIYMSTDAVFSSDRERIPFKETDVPNPINWYAKTKLQGEAIVQDEACNGLVVRANLFGWNRFEKGGSLAEWALENLSRGIKISGFTDIWFNPVYAGKLSCWLLHLARSQKKGVLHLGALNSCSKYEFLQQLASVWGYDKNLIQPLPMPDSPTVPRTRYTCLDTSAALENVPTNIPSIEQGLREMKTTWEKAIRST